MYNIDHTSFCELTPDAQYWAGVLATDGWIYKPKKGSHSIGLELHEQDREHVAAFLSFLKTDRPVLTHSRPCKKITYARAMVVSSPIARRLETLGITQRKTYSLEICDELAVSNHFWRGAFDGDGSISINGGIGFVSGSDVFLRQLQTYMCTFGLNVNVAKCSKANAYRLDTHSRSFVKHLYAGRQISLPRKQQIADSIR